MEYQVIVCVSVTADTPQEASRYAMDDLRDLNLGPWYVRVMPETDRDAVSDLIDDIAPALLEVA